MAGISEISYKDQKILLIDNTGLQGEDVVNNTKEGSEKIISSQNSENLLLIDMTGVFATPEVDNQMKEVGRNTVSYLKKLAVVGMATGAKKVLVTTFAKITGVNMKLFNSVDEAKDWLIS